CCVASKSTQTFLLNKPPLLGSHFAATTELREPFTSSFLALNPKTQVGRLETNSLSILPRAIKKDACP
ncbi:hypothetical protein, partial [Vibrio parahaemolyticus]|uniref:hypothetical protein n=1 Tax=Vibrio parahaemolyticus TaxID=670 RepID=UPI001C60AF77